MAKGFKVGLGAKSEVKRLFTFSISLLIGEQAQNVGVTKDTTEA